MDKSYYPQTRNSLSFSFPAAKQQQAQKTGRPVQAVQGRRDQRPENTV